MKTITLSPEEHVRLVELYQRAQRTPVLIFAPGRDTASVAWESVRTYLDELAKKYGYKAQTARISMDSPSFEAEEAG